LIKGEISKGFNMATYPPTKGNPGLRDKLKELSALKYGRPLAEVEAEIKGKYLQ
jgi:hypothetical protein